MELYDSPERGVRPIFYGLGNFFWSDVQDPLPHDLYQENRELMAQAWKNPERATDYDLTAPLNAASFAHPFTFQSVIAVTRFQGNQLSELRLYAVEEGYGERLPRSGIPRLVGDPADAARIFRQIEDANRRFGVGRLELEISGNVATAEPSRRALRSGP